jgi:hypothetical protein
MDDWILPDELQRLETDLGRRRLPEASSDLPQRILGGLQHRRRVAESQARWQFGLAVAASVLVWMNLSLCATQATNFDLRPRAVVDSEESIETIARQIERLAPDLPPEEVRRQAILMRASANMTFMPSFIGLVPRT